DLADVLHQLVVLRLLLPEGVRQEARDGRHRLHLRLSVRNRPPPLSAGSRGQASGGCTDTDRPSARLDLNTLRVIRGEAVIGLALLRLLTCREECVDLLAERLERPTVVIVEVSILHRRE